jgi:hypothetical protein
MLTRRLPVFQYIAAGADTPWELPHVEAAVYVQDVSGDV